MVWCLPHRVLLLTPNMWARRYRDSRANERHLQLSSLPASFPLWGMADRPALRTTSSCHRADRHTQRDEEDSWVNRPGWETAASGKADRNLHSCLNPDEWKFRHATNVILGLYEWLTCLKITWGHTKIRNTSKFVSTFTSQYFTPSWKTI